MPFGAPNNLPQRFSERVFRTYEPFIAAAVKAYPTPIKVFPDKIGLSQATFAGRFRDAKRSLREHNWVSTQVDISKFLECYTDLVCSERAGHVLIGSREQVYPPKPTETAPEDSYTNAASADSYIVDCLVLEHKELIVKLASDRILNRPVTVTGFSETDVQYFEERFDVVFTLQPTGDYLLQ